MGSTFNPQILVDKLAKLNNSQQSIETLSHWCIFHMNKAKLVVETWERQFHCSPRERRLAFLYLANDILQNSRRKGAEFVAEFWRVLPEALRDVIRNGDDFGRNAALRLISIWDERKVFGSRGHILKEEFMGRQPENNNRSGRQFSLKLRQSVGEMLDKIISDYEVLYGGQLDEDEVLSRCSNTVSGLEKIVKDIDSRGNSGQQNGSGPGEELQGKHAVLRECIEQLTALETSRAILVSHLREALQEQELKLDQVRGQLQAAQLQWEQSSNMCREFVGGDKRQVIDDPSMKGGHGSGAPPGFTWQSSAPPVIYKRQVCASDRANAVGGDDDSRKSTAAAVAAKLTASTASAEMLSHVLTSLVSGGIIDHAMKESPSEHQQSSEKRQKVENETPPPPPPPAGQPESEPPLPPFPHPDTSVEQQPPPPSSSPPPLPPLPPVPPVPPSYAIPPQFLHTAGAMSNVSYTYGSTSQHLQSPPLPSYTPVAVGVPPPPPPPPPYVVPPLNPYQNFQCPDAPFYNPPSSVPMSSISRQQTL